MGRVKVDFSEKATQDLGELAKQMKTTEADTIKKALALLKIAIEEQENGSVIVFENKKKKTKRELEI